MKELPGRKSVIFFSDGFSILKDVTEPERHEATPPASRRALRRLTDAANRASVVIYTMDARGLAITTPTAADSVGSARRPSPRSSGASDELVRNQEGLSYLAEQTGGIFIKNTNDLDAGVRRVLEDQKGYYLIGFRPAADAFEPERRARRASTSSRSRSAAPAYACARARASTATRKGRRSPPARTRAEQLMAALTSPLSSGESARCA